jgi:hypothetical protein
VCALRRENRVGSIQPPVPQPRACISSGRASKAAVGQNAASAREMAAAGKANRLTLSANACTRVGLLRQPPPSCLIRSENFTGTNLSRRTSC